MNSLYVIYVLDIQFLIDTITSFNPVTFEEEQRIVKTEYPIIPSDATAIHFNQKWFYNKKSNQIKTVVESITIHYIEANQSILKFYIKVNNNIPLTTDLFSDNNFILGQRIGYTGDFKDSDMAKYVFKEAHQINNKLYNKLGEPLVEQKFPDDFGSYIDTVIIFNPETFQEEIKIIKQPAIHHPNIKDFRVVQDVYFDPEKMIIKIQVLGIAPTRPVFDDNEDFKYYSPLAWIVYDNAFFNQ